MDISAAVRTWIFAGTWDHILSGGEQLPAGEKPECCHAGLHREQEKVPDEVSEELKEEARAYNKKLREGTVVLTDPFDPDALKYVTDDYEKMLDTDGSGRMGYLEIPSHRSVSPDLSRNE